MATPGNKPSLDGTVPGLRSNHLRSGHSRNPLDGYPDNALSHPQADYRPDPGQMDIPTPDYHCYTAGIPQATMPELRQDPVERHFVPRPSLYEISAQAFAIQDRQAQEIYDLSFQRVSVDSSAISPADDEPGNPEGLRSHQDPVDAFAIEMSINRAAMGHAAMEPLPQSTPSDLLEQLVEEYHSPDPAAEMASQLEQMTQQMVVPPPVPEPEEPDPYEEMFNQFGSMGPM